MRYALLSCLIAMIATPATAQEYRFANIPWESDGATVKRLMAAQGLVLQKVDSDGDYSFKGQLVGYDAIVWALMAKDALVKVHVVLLTPDQNAREAYRDMKAVLTGKYGEPKDVIERFDQPYYQGDGYEDQAIKLGKGHFFTLWESITGADTSDMALQVSEQLNVLISYESPRWDAEADRRKAKATRAF